MNLGHVCYYRAQQWHTRILCALLDGLYQKQMRLSDVWHPEKYSVSCFMSVLTTYFSGIFRLAGVNHLSLREMKSGLLLVTLETFRLGKFKLPTVWLYAVRITCPLANRESLNWTTVYIYNYSRILGSQAKVFRCPTLIELTILT